MTFQELNKIKVNKLSDLTRHVFNLDIFKGGERITQRWNDKDGLDYAERVGHDGIDIIPVIPGNNDVHAVEEGEVIYAGWDTNIDWSSKRFYQGYGILTIVWNRANNRIWIYAHLSSNLGIKEGMQIKRGDKVGVMGGSGFGILNKWPIHLHLGLFAVDELARVINRNNGFWGASDPSFITEELKNKTMNNYNEMYKIVDLADLDRYEAGRGFNTKKHFEKPYLEMVILITEDFKNLMIQRQDIWTENAELKRQLYNCQNAIKIDYPNNRPISSPNTTTFASEPSQSIQNDTITPETSNKEANTSNFQFSWNQQYETLVKTGVWKYLVVGGVSVLRNYLMKSGVVLPEELYLTIFGLFGVSGGIDNVKYIMKK
jgi:hypothetical protein